MSSERLIVMKFGGTSVGHAERFRQCADIIRHAAGRDRVVVVVSAMAGVTDLIFKAIEAARHGESAATAAHLQRFQELHRELVRSLFDLVYIGDAEGVVANIAAQLRGACEALSALRSDISAQTADSLVALGERISAWVLARYLQQDGGRAEFVPAEDVIATDSNFGNAAPETEITRSNCRRVLLPLLERDVVPVVAGYSGANAQGKTTTLGRGGSDYSATIIGAALAAHEVWIWTDVDGVLTADPRVCANASTLPEISFAEAIELAYYGAKVIHPKAAYPAEAAGFPVWIKNSFSPQVEGTRITHAARSVNSPVKAVTSVKNATLITLVTRRNVHPVELWGRLFLRLGQEQIEVLFATQSSPEHTLGILLRSEDAPQVLKLVRTIFRVELAQGLLDPVQVNSEVSVVAVLGESMRGRCGILGRVFSAVARQEVSVIAVAQGASELSICFAVPAARSPEVVRAVHDEFYGPAADNVPLCLRPNFSVTGAQ